MARAASGNAGRVAVVASAFGGAQCTRTDLGCGRVGSRFRSCTNSAGSSRAFKTAVRALSVRQTLIFVILWSEKLNSVHLEENKISTESDNFKSLYKNVLSK